MTAALAKHPAKFSDPILDVLRGMVRREADLLGRRPLLLDPFAGTGKIHQLEDVADTRGVELRPRWAACHPRTLVGDATRLHWRWTDRFDVVATSCCLAQEHRVLTDDLRWVAVGDVCEGDRLLAFEEEAPRRRRWQRAEVVRSVPRSVEAVRVILANGDEIVTTPEHPWLAARHAYGGVAQEWITSARLMGGPGRGATRGHRSGERQPYHVMLQVAPWVARRSYDAGWLAGMFDGEGCLSLGSHGTPKMSLCQVDGPVLDRAERLMHEFGYEPGRIARKHVPEQRQPISNLYVTGGFPGLLRALGELRPTRLLDKWAALDVSARTVQAERVAVLAVEPAGRVDIQEIETTSGTYIGEGYLMHNCYGNRFADHHDARERCSACAGLGVCGNGTDDPTSCEKCGGAGTRDWTRHSYAHDYGEPFEHPSDAGVMHFGRDGAYETLHERAWRQARRVLRPDDSPEGPGLFLLNVSNFVRKHEEVDVIGWHRETLRGLGFVLVGEVPVETRRMGFGANRSARTAHEVVLALRAPTAGTRRRSALR